MAKSCVILSLSLLLHLGLASSGLAYDDECATRRCRAHGPDIRFPFRLKGRHPRHCGYPDPGFELSCSGSMGTVLELPLQIRVDSVTISEINKHQLSVKLLVESIDYSLQEVSSTKAVIVGCLPELLLKMESFGSPFQFNYGNDFIFFNCTSNRTDHEMLPVTCLSSPGYHVYAVPSSVKTCTVPLFPCTRMFNVSGIPYGILNLWSPITMNWRSPFCEGCEIEHKYCRLKNDSMLETQCYGKIRAKGPSVKELSTISGTILFSIPLLFLIAACYKLYKANKRKKDDEVKIEHFLEDYKALKPTRYDYADIKKITENFSERLGQGGYGTVYKGKLSNDVFVAVKLLNNLKGNGEEFINEVSTIGRIHHVNVVRLVGYCAEGVKRALVYEFLPNDSLQVLLSSNRQKNMLGWKKLHQIAVEIATGIEYLHQGCDQRILHFDIKPHNILLDHNFSPKLSDFGEAKLCSKDKSVVSMTAARGTMGYIAPEVFSRNFGNASYKSDVYSFGMLLLEMVGIRESHDISSQESSQVYFPQWIYDRLDKGEEIAVQIEKEDDCTIIRKLTIVGLWCIQWYPMDRPPMKTVIQMLVAEDIPPMPRHPFGKTAMSGSSFSSELEVIPEQERMMVT